MSRTTLTMFAVLMMTLPSFHALAAARQDSTREEVISEPTPAPRPRGGTHCGTSGPGFEQWRFWWENNKDPYLERSRDVATLVTRRFIERPTWDETADRIIPVLKEALTVDDPDVVDAAVLALGRITPTERSALVFDDVRTVLGNRNETPQQSALLSLGAIGSPAAIPLLVEVMNDSAEGRLLMHSNGEIHEMQRSFAAISLGSIGGEATLASLFSALRDATSGSTGFRASVVLALGLFRERRDTIVAELTSLLDDPSLDATIRAQIPVSLARLGEPAEIAIPRLLQLLLANETDRRVRQSAAIALGVLAGPNDSGVVPGLEETVVSGADDQTRHFAMIALSDVAVRAAAVSDATAVNDVAPFLTRELNGGSRTGRATHRPWAALSLARIGRALDPTSFQRAAIAADLSRAFDDETDPSYVAALAISLAIVDARTAGPKILDTLKLSNDALLKGYCAIALGLLRHVAAEPTLHELLLDHRDSRLRLRVATALGLMGDPDAAPLLVDALRNAKTLGMISSIANSLGVLGDRRAIEPLAAVVRDEKAPGLARGFACVALGLIAEKTRSRFTEPLSRNANYRTVVGAQYEILDIL